MRIKSIRGQNLLCHRVINIDIPQDANVVLVAGPNGSGKSALLEGIRVALGAPAPAALAERDVSLKKDTHILITQGETNGWVGVSVVKAEREDEYKFSLKTGNFAGSSPPALGGALYALDPAAFFSLEPGDRRKALFQHAGISMSKADIIKDLTAKGHDPKRISTVEYGLSAGITKTADLASAKASEARGAWQTITGERYGSQKGEDWKAEAPELWDDPGDLAEQLRDLLTRQQTAVNLRDTLESAEAAHQRASDLRADAEKLADHEVDVQTFTEQLDDARAALQRVESNGRAGWTCPCPECGTVLFSPAAATLEVHAPSEVAPSEAAGVAAKHRKAIAALEADLSKAKAAAERARAAKLALERLPERPTAAELAEARQAATAAIEEHRIGDDALKRAQRLRDEAASAAGRTKDAKAHHEDVVAYSALAEALNALPGDYLGKALATINAQLQEVSSVLGATVSIGDDMGLRYGTIPYRTASKSQKWRVQLALALVLGRKHGLVVIDEFDLVDVADRPGILLLLAKQTDVQVIIGATLKAKPPAIPGVFTHWTGRD